MGALSDYLEERFGVRTRTIVNAVTGSAGAGATLVAKENADRLMLLVINLDEVAMWLGWDTGITNERGVLVDASGGYVSLIADEDGELVGYETYLYSVAGGYIFVVETEAA